MPDEWIGDGVFEGWHFSCCCKRSEQMSDSTSLWLSFVPFCPTPRTQSCNQTKQSRLESAAAAWAARDREGCVCGNFCRPRWITTGLKMHQAITLRHCAWTRLLTEQTSTRTKEKINPSFVHPRPAGTRTPPSSKDARFSDIYSKYLCEMWHDWWIPPQLDLLLMYEHWNQPGTSPSRTKKWSSRS